MGKLDGKVVLITGAAGGQGRSHAVGCAREGADLILIDRCAQLDSVEYEMPGEDALRESVRAAEEAGATVVSAVADVRDAAAMEDVVSRGVEELGRLDVVGANAGISTYGPLCDISEQTWDEMIGVNLTGVWQTLRATVPRLVDQGEGGSVICTSSCAGLKGFANAGHYSAAKHGVVGMVRTLAQEVGPHGIRVNALCPFSVETSMIMNEPTYALMTGGENPTREAALEVFDTLTVLPEPLAQPQDITNAFLFLASDDGRCFTGHALPVDLGFMAKM